ncbi:MAG: YlmC/YmxH family sporulation protein [Firmicutes bacterium]|nr:YlmC/YmxH family sporulation protein [Bacillota bacterium]MDD4263100.1 YlmC/YmxH family sporulation protein [Bacillota bacterium]MDD4693427.1 YlmC/YmxH family sporulation protein [Bacillota bacterium]
MALGTRFNEIRQKEVVDTLTGMKLGEIIDLEVDMHTGQITALIVPGINSLWGIFRRREDVVIPWTKIKTIGKDVILVDASNIGINY